MCFGTEHAGDIAADQFSSAPFLFGVAAGGARQLTENILDAARIPYIQIIVIGGFCPVTA